MARPYTIRFGPWVPDLQDVGVEMPYQWSDTELPVADCLNVYWQDGAYRCTPAPVSFGPSLGTPALDCFTWYDNTQGKEVLFAATANGFYTLIDGVWSEIATQTDTTALGLVLSLQLGSPVGLATAMSPTSRTASGSASSYTFPALSAVIGYGTATYNWTFSGASGPGSWSIASGQGTASAAPKVTGATTTASAVTLNCAITFSGTVYNISGTLSYTVTFSPTTVTHASGSGTETVPAGASHVTIEVWGGGGSGGTGDGVLHGFGGGAAGYSRSYYACSGGQTLHYAVGAGGAAQTVAGTNGNAGTVSSVSSGTLSITTMTANPGGGGNRDGDDGGTIGGSPGTATGGNQANVTGAAAPTNSVGALSSAGIYANTTHAAGMNGAGSAGPLNAPSNAGYGGLVSFHYT